MSDEPITSFLGRPLPVPARPAGYGALIDRFDCPVPLHYEMAAVSPKRIRRREDGWAIYPASLWPGPDIVDHLVFALKYEGVQLLTLKTVFQRFDKRELEAAARARPTSGYLHRLCFFYEWLTQDILDVPDVSSGAYILALDPEQQYATLIRESNKRFRVWDNLPGTSAFCPLVFKTKCLDDYIKRDLSRAARDIVENAPKELIARAAAFLLLGDSKASFAIEGENPSKDRVARWGSIVGTAGRLSLHPHPLIELQRQLIGDDRFVRIGLRDEGGFVGRHDAFGQPVPEHVSARHDDLADLLSGLWAFNARSKRGYDPVLTAASIAFGFVYIHPFEDGNGRIHRFLLHNVLAERGYTPDGIVFPISSVILDDIARYKDVLERVSLPLLDWIQWHPTEKGNVDILNETADYYRYFDATAHAEFLFKCIERAVEKDLPEELAFLERRDAFHRRATRIVDMPERTLDLLLRFLKQGHGTLSQRARTGEFAKLTDEEAKEMEALYADLFKLQPSLPFA